MRVICQDFTDGRLGILRHGRAVVPVPGTRGERTTDGVARSSMVPGYAPDRPAVAVQLP